MLNINTIDVFDPFVIPEKIYTSDTPFDILNSNFEPLKTLPSNFTKAYVLLCYNNDEDKHKCYYSLANYGENKYLTPDETKKFINFKVLRTVDTKTIEQYLKEDFYNAIGSKKLSIDDLKKEYARLMMVTRDVFNRSTQSTFTQQIVEAVESEGLIDPHELPFFKVYVSVLRTANPYDLQIAMNHVLSFIYPDLLTTSSSM